LRTLRAVDASVAHAGGLKQWLTRTHYVTDLHIGFLSGRLLMTWRAFAQLPVQAQDRKRQNEAATP
jgi:hypothetical protein